MNCPQCNTSLPDSATFCYKCGTSTRSTAFSYLPEGTPAWPATAPQSPFYTPGAPGQVVAQNGEPGAASFKAASTKQRRSARSILLLVALIVLTPVIGILATLGTLWMNGTIPIKTVTTSVHVPPVSQPTPASTPAPGLTPTTQSNQLPTPSSFQTANSTALGISLKYPSDWVADAPQTNTAGNVSVAFHPQQQLPVNLSVGRLSPTNSSSVPNTGVVNQANLEGFGTDSSLKNMQILTNTPQHPTIGGTVWDEQDASYVTSSGAAVHAVSISVKHNNIYFNIFYFAPSSVYDEAVQKYYSQMLSSFQFLS
ncbi:MAG TPA: zinc-ribbon domain-containing protein [Ktedonobacteraceae bacterium]|nr:zinc-ribbon domain-containing protein [Ktedonobacteraceae bacterium]